jgi:hypothetical protein
MNARHLEPKQTCSLALLLIAGCRDVIGVETRSEGPPLLALPEACFACAEESCSRLERACAADAGCATVAACVTSRVDDPAARVGCEEGLLPAAYFALDACLRAACRSACFGDRGLFARHEVACESCMNDSCSDSMADCIADRTCERTALVAVGDPGEIDPPRSLPLTEALNARPLEQAIDNCAVTHCAEPCRFDGTNLDCKSAYQWPQPQSSVVDVEFYVSAVQSFSVIEPVGGALVDFCEDGFDACVPSASGTTDPTGAVTVELAIAPLTGYRGYVRVSDGSSGAELYPTHVYLAHPITTALRYGQYVPTRDFAELVAKVAPGGQDPALGALGVIFLDCANNFVPGMKIELPSGALDGATVLYPTGDVTGDSGVFAFNLQPGCHELVGRLDGEITHRARVVVPAGVLAVTYVSPLSDPEDLGAICEPMFRW